VPFPPAHPSFIQQPIILRDAKNKGNTSQPLPKRDLFSRPAPSQADTRRRLPPWRQDTSLPVDLNAQTQGARASQQARPRGAAGAKWRRRRPPTSTRARSLPPLRESTLSFFFLARVCPSDNPPPPPPPLTPMAPVYLNVYDLSPYNDLLHCIGLGGIYHSAVECHGVEYSYGAHSHACSGVFATPPRECGGGALAVRASIYVGETRLSARETQECVARLGETRFHGNRYHLLQLNCNAFAEALAGELVVVVGGGGGGGGGGGCGGGGGGANDHNRKNSSSTTTFTPPGWINRLAGLAVALHCLLPASWVPPLLMAPPPTAASSAAAVVVGGGGGGGDCERQPLVGGGNGVGGGSSNGNGAAGYYYYQQQRQQQEQRQQSAVVAPPTAERAMGAGGRAGAGAVGSGRRPGTAWPAADPYEDVP
jgi:deubiquitinase DESI2